LIVHIVTPVLVAVEEVLLTGVDYALRALGSSLVGWVVVAALVAQVYGS
jgi:hypothetical protein